MTSKSNKIVITSDYIYMNGRFLDSTYPLNTSTSFNNTFFNDRIIISHRKLKDVSSTICLTQNNLLNNILPINGGKIVTQKYNHYSILNSYNLDYTKCNYLFPDETVQEIMEASASALTIKLDINAIYNNSLNFDASYLWKSTYDINPYGAPSSHKFVLFNDSINAYNKNLNIFIIDQRLIGYVVKHIPATQTNFILDISNIVPNIPLNFSYSFLTDAAQGAILDFSHVNVTIFNYRPFYHSIYAQDIEKIFYPNWMEWPGSPVSDVSYETTLLASYRDSYNCFTGSPTYYFTGSNRSYYNLSSVNTISPVNGYTYSMWINSTNILTSNQNTLNLISNTQDTSYAILSFGETNAHPNIAIYVNNNQIYCEAGSSSGHTDRLDINTIANTWYHLLITYVEDKIDIYLNTKFIEITQIYPPPKQITPTDNNFIGKYTGSVDTNTPFRGRMCDILILNTVLQPPDIMILYTNQTEEVYKLLSHYYLADPNTPVILDHRSIFQDDGVLNYELVSYCQINKPAQIWYETGTTGIWKMLQSPSTTCNKPPDMSGGGIKFYHQSVDLSCGHPVYQPADFYYFTYSATLKDPHSFPHVESSNIAKSSYILRNAPVAVSHTYNAELNTPLQIKLEAHESYYRDSSNNDKKNNGAYEFNAHDKYIYLEPLDDFADCIDNRMKKEITISTWVYHTLDSYNWKESLISFHEPNHKVLLELNQIYSQIAEFIYTVDDKEVFVSSPIQYYQWYHITLIHSQDQYVKFYIDDKLDISITPGILTGSILQIPDLPIIQKDASTNSLNKKFWLGATYTSIDNTVAGTMSNYFSGTIKDFYIFNKILSDTNISHMFLNNELKVIQSSCKYPCCSIIDSTSFNLIDELSYYIDLDNESIIKIVCHQKETINESSIKGKLENINGGLIYGENYNIETHIHINEWPEKNIVTFIAKELGISYFRFYVRDKVTGLESCHAIITFNVGKGGGGGGGGCDYLMPEIKWTRERISCSRIIPTHQELVNKQKLAIQFQQNNNVKLTKNQQYAAIANRRLRQKYINKC